MRVKRLTSRGRRVNPWAAKRAVTETLRCEGESGEVSVAFVDDVRMRQLNERYRGVARATDVLAFPLRDDEEGPGEGGPARRSKTSRLTLPGEGGKFLGEIVISIDTAVRQGKEFRQSLEREVALYLIHGTLHLLGFDDADVRGSRLMRKKEKEVLTRLFPEE